MIQQGQVYKNKRNNKEYYRVVGIDDHHNVDTRMFAFEDEEEHVKEKRVVIYMPYFEEAFVERSEEELAMKLLSRM